MQAVVLEEKGGDYLYSLKVVPVPTPSAGKALVRIKFAALNHRDLWMGKGLYPGLKLPCIIGSDGAGQVVSVGSSTDKEWVNKRVMINPAIRWGADEEFPSASFTILGMPLPGTLAEYINVETTQLIEIPAHLSYEQAASIPLAGLTAYRACFTKGKLSPKKRILITGVGGGVACFALLFAISTGAETYVTSSSQQKIEKAISLGAAGGVRYTEKNWDQQLISLAGKNGAKTKRLFDLVVDSAGGNDFNKCLGLLRGGGSLVFVGATAGRSQEELPLHQMFLLQQSIVGSTMGSPREFVEMVQRFEREKLVPVVHKVFPLSQIHDALNEMSSAAQFGKIVVSLAVPSKL